jgi:hypothetical protein
LSGVRDAFRKCEGGDALATAGKMPALPWRA